MRALILIFIVAVTLALYKAGKLPYFQNTPAEEQSEQAEATPAPQAIPTAQATPALGVDQAKAQAIRMYPALAQKDSPFNKAFVLLYTQSKVSNPQLLATSDWPLRLAKQVAASLGVAPQALPAATPAIEATPAFVAAPTVAATPRPWGLTGTALDARPKKKP